MAHMASAPRRRVFRRLQQNDSDSDLAFTSDSNIRALRTKWPLKGSLAPIPDYKRIWYMRPQFMVDLVVRDSNIKK